MKTHAEFLEELKKYIDKAQKYYLSIEKEYQNSEVIYEINILLEKIEQFEVGQKEVEDERMD